MTFRGSGEDERGAFDEGAGLDRESPDGSRDEPSRSRTGRQRIRISKWTKAVLKQLAAHQLVSVTLLSISLSFTLAFVVNQYTQIFSDESGWRRTTNSTTATDLDVRIERDLTVRDDLNLSGSGSVLTMAGPGCGLGPITDAKIGVLCFDPDEGAFKVREGSGGFNTLAYSDSAAVAAMGSEGLANPLNHGRYTDKEVIASVLDVYGENGVLSAELLQGYPVEHFATLIEHERHANDPALHVEIYTDSRARAAMGSESPANTLNHRRYTEKEVVEAVLGTFSIDGALNADLLDGRSANEYATDAELRTHGDDTGLHGEGYTDVQARLAMGADFPTNPLNHARYAGNEVISAVLDVYGQGGLLSADLLGGQPIDNFALTADLSAHSKSMLHGVAFRQDLIVQPVTSGEAIALGPLAFNLATSGWIQVVATGYLQPSPGNETRIRLRADKPGVPSQFSLALIYQGAELEFEKIDTFSVSWVFMVDSGDQEIWVLVGEDVGGSAVTVSITSIQATYFVVAQP